MLSFVVISCVPLKLHGLTIPFFGLFVMLSRLLHNSENVGHMVGQVHATEYAHDAIEFLNSGNWIQNGQISLDKLQVFLEFTSYVNYLTPRERRVASIIEIKPIDSLFDFAMKISNKLQELPHTHSLSPIISDFSGLRLC